MNTNAAIAPWETFHAYRARAGFSPAWRGRLRELVAVVEAHPGVTLRPAPTPGRSQTAPGRPWHTLRFDRGRDRWGSTAGGQPGTVRSGAARSPWSPPTITRGAASRRRHAHSRRGRRCSSTSSTATPTTCSPSPPPPRADSSPFYATRPYSSPRDWRAFAADPAVLDGVLAVYCTTGNVELALSVIEAARERGELD